MQGNTPGVYYDIDQVFGQDVQLTNTGDLAVVSGIDESNQRVLRRLLTNPGDYIWHTDYGAGVPSYVGEALTSQGFQNLSALIRSQIFLESSVARQPLPVIDLETIFNGLSCQIQYTQLPSNSPTVLSFNINE
jgi:phage baseplate assembly protein W